MVKVTRGQTVKIVRSLGSATVPKYASSGHEIEKLTAALAQVALSRVLLGTNKLCARPPQYTPPLQVDLLHYIFNVA